MKTNNFQIIETKANSWYEECVIFDPKNTPANHNPKIIIWSNPKSNGWIHKYIKSNVKTPIPNMNPFKFKI